MEGATVVKPSEQKAEQASPSSRSSRQEDKGER